MVLASSTTTDATSPITAGTQSDALIDLCIQCCDSFNRSRGTAHTHCEEFLSSLSTQTYTDTDRQIIRSVVMGVIGANNTHKLLTMTVEALFNTHSGSTQRREQTLLTVVMYVILFSEQRKTLLQQVDRDKLERLISFFSQSEIQTWMQQQWRTLYDREYVDVVLMPRVRSAQGEMITITEETKDGLSNTLSQPFTPSLSVSRVVSPLKSISRYVSEYCLPSPLCLSTVYHARPVPDSLSKTSLAIIEQRRQRRKQERHKHIHTQAHAETQERRHLHTETRATQRQGQTQSLNSQSEEEEKTQETVSVVVASLSPASLFVHPPTAASILREQRIQQMESQTHTGDLQKFSTELRDASEFLAWQQNMKQEDERKQKWEIDKRKQELKHSKFKVTEQLKNMTQHKAQEVTQAKEEYRQRTLIIKQQTEEERQRRTETAKQLTKDHTTHLTQVIEQTQREKRMMAQQIHAEKEQREKDRQVLIQSELSEKQQLISQISALESLAAVKAKRANVVQTSTGTSSGLLLLSEMSIVEMRERLRLLQETEQQQQERKRQSIQQDKHNKKAVLQQLLQQQKQHRKQRTHQREQERQQRKQQKLQTEGIIAAQLSAQICSYEQKRKDKKREQSAAALLFAQQVKDNTAFIRQLKQHRNTRQQEQQRQQSRQPDRCPTVINA